MSTFRFMVAAAGLIAAPVFAQSHLEPSPFDRDRVAVGAGLAVIPDYEGSDHYSPVVAPAAIGSVEGHSFVLAGNQLSIDLLRDRPGPGWRFKGGPVAQVNFNRNTPSDIHDPRVRALGAPGTAIELGGYVGVQRTGVVTSPYDTLSLTLSYRHDVAGIHDAGLWQPGLTYFTPLSLHMAVAFTASVDMAEDRYARTYYSVSPAQSLRSGMPVYDAKGGIKNWTIGLVGVRTLRGNLLHGLHLVALGTFGGMTGSIGDSPIVAQAGSRQQWLGALGLAYSF
ncbi:MipA/OmpV family protein [Sphingomonas sp. NCPPB 2930]|uniref:MipA/OmpV family protein n=1 Tax=Sphingomonas sp. NCPPB 2930 TaxID=3162788 RepID=UPI0036DF4A21